MTHINLFIKKSTGYGKVTRCKEDDDEYYDALVLILTGIT
jgi:hypothetical protein